MGFKGKGLGKDEDGIIEPIEIKEARVIGTAIEREKPIIYIASDSMLNQMEEDRLSTKYKVMVQCHSGCTIKCLYSHLPKMIGIKPEHIILHIGTNDCTTKTSDEVMKELKKLVDDIQQLLPNTNIIISQLITRTDNTTANQIIRNLSMKLKQLNYKILNNSNLEFKHLGRKGLHFNEHGVRKMALNLISLIKQL